MSDCSYCGRPETEHPGGVYCPLPTGMCPHCGDEVTLSGSLTTMHDWPHFTRQMCPGSGQIPRNAESDARPLWNGEPNRRFTG